MHCVVGYQEVPRFFLEYIPIKVIFCHYIFVEGSASYPDSIDSLFTHRI